jgi:nuclear pore complex protein Nup205
MKAGTGATEMLLLLLWRHSDYYSQGHHINNPNLRASTIRMTRFLATLDTDTFRVELGKKLAPVLQRLDVVSLFLPSPLNSLSIDAHQDLERFGDDWGSNQAYIEVMRRRLRTTVGFQDASEPAH